MESLLTVKETAKTLHVSAATIYMLTERKAIPCVRIGARVLFKPADLEAWVAARTVPAEARQA